MVVAVAGRLTVMVADVFLQRVLAKYVGGRKKIRFLFLWASHALKDKVENGKNKNKEKKFEKWIFH